MRENRLFWTTVWSVCLSTVIANEHPLRHRISLTHDYFHSHREMTVFLRKIARSYPDITYLYSIGTSVKGADLSVIAVASRYPHEHLPLRTEVAFIGNLHGDEPVGKELLLRFLTYILQSYGVNPMVTRLLDYTRIHLFPLANPDGFASSPQGSCDLSFGRNNANNVDLFADFPGIWQLDIGKLQLETKAIIKWVDSLSFSLMLSFYGGLLVVSYPFDHVTEGTAPKYSATPDDDVFRYVARAYSKAHKRLANGSFCPNSLDFYPNGITNGAERANTQGSMHDYLYYAKGVMAIGAYISCCRYPYRVTLRKFWKENKQSMLEFWNQSQQGVKGFVVDGHGKGLESTLQVQGRDVTFRSSSIGEYSRILLPGKYVLSVKADGYSQMNVRVVVKAGQMLINNITMFFEEDTFVLPRSKARDSVKNFDYGRIMKITPKGSETGNSAAYGRILTFFGFSGRAQRITRVLYHLVFMLLVFRAQP